MLHAFLLCFLFLIVKNWNIYPSSPDWEQVLLVKKLKQCYLAELSDTDSEHRVYAILSLPVDVPNEYIFPPLWSP